MTGEQLAGLTEAIDWWRLELPDGRQILTTAAAQLIVVGLDSPAVVDLASMYDGESRARVDSIVADVVVQLDLAAALAVRGLPAIRLLCRRLLAGQMSERELSRWAHSQFHHQSESELLNELALLDDYFDEYDQYYVGGEAESRKKKLVSRVRHIAQEILASP